MGDDLHVVFGSGPAGRAVAIELTRQGLTTRIINRSGRPVLDGADTVGGDVLDPRFARAAAHGAHTVYFCLNAPHYHRWADEFPPLQDAVVDAAERRRSPTRRPREPLHVRAHGRRPDDRVDPDQPDERQERGPGPDVRRAHRRSPPRSGGGGDRAGRRLRRAGRRRVGDGRARVRVGPRRQGSPHDRSTRHPPLVQLRARRRSQPRAAREPSTMPTDASGTSPTHPRAPPERSSPTSTPRSTDQHASRSSANRCCE